MIMLAESEGPTQAALGLYCPHIAEDVFACAVQMSKGINVNDMVIFTPNYVYYPMHSRLLMDLP